MLWTVVKNNTTGYIDRMADIRKHIGKGNCFYDILCTLPHELCPGIVIQKDYKLIPVKPADNGILNKPQFKLVADFLQHIIRCHITNFMNQFCKKVHVKYQQGISLPPALVFQQRIPYHLYGGLLVVDAGLYIILRTELQGQLQIFLLVDILQCTIDI